MNVGEGLFYKKLNFWIPIFVLIFYSCRGFFESIGFSNVHIIGMNVFLIVINFMVFIVKEKMNRELARVLIYIYYGVFLFIISSLFKSYIVTTMAFVSIYINLIFWFLVYSNGTDKNIEKISKSYLEVFVWLVVVNSILGVYQYFVDPSIFGLVTNRIYGNAEVLNLAHVTRRSTGLLGSPQNYSLFMGVGIFSLGYIDLKKSKRIILFIIILLGGLVSGSRTFGLFLILYILFLISRKRYLNIKRLIIVLLSAFLGLCILFFINFDFLLSNGTIIRVMAYNSWAALEIFKDNIESMSLFDFIFGKGFGLQRWIASGEIVYDYSEVESYTVNILNQMGLVGVLLFLFIYMKNLLSSIKLNNGYQFMLIGILINIFVTPSFNGFAMSFILWPFIIYPSLKIRYSV